MSVILAHRRNIVVNFVLAGHQTVGLILTEKYLIMYLISILPVLKSSLVIQSNSGLQFAGLSFNYRT